MRYSTTLGCVAVLCVALVGNANATTAQFSDSLDLTNLQYNVETNMGSAIAAADIKRFDMGTGWEGAMEFLLTTSSYYSLPTSLGIALTTDPNDTLFNDPSPFLQLVDPDAVTDFFNDNVLGWVFYSWGSNITPGGTTDVMAAFTNPPVFDPNEHYYAFVAGGSVIPLTVAIDLVVNDETGAGDVGAVPIPAAVWLFGSGIAGLLGITRRKRAALAA